MQSDIRRHLCTASIMSLALVALGCRAAPSPPTGAAKAAAAVPDLSGLWVVRDFVFSARPTAERKMRTVDGEEPPFNSAARALYEKRANDADAGRPFADTASRCLPNGMPLMMYDAPYPLQIIQEKKQVTMIFEENATFRIIYLDEKLPEDPDPTYVGRSVGHYEGATLVVRTIGLNDMTTLDKLGLPHSDKMKIEERIKRIAPELIEDLITIDDPDTYTKPWTFKHTYKPWPADKKIMEYVCNDNQRNSPLSDGSSGFAK